MQNLPLQSSMVYGPVGSRRIGLSLGVNLSPFTQKLCSFNCVYCHYGWTRVLTTTPETKDIHFPDVGDLQRQLESFQVDHMLLDHVTFSGNGESTQHPDFGRAVEIVTAFRDRFAEQARTAILSNSTTVGDPAVRKALLELDRRIMKVDAGDEKTFMQMNRPPKSLKLQHIIDGLKALGDFETQTTFVDGSVCNATDEAVESWLKVMSELQPKAVQIYTLDRPPADQHLQPVSRERMRDILLLAKNADLNVTLY